MLVQLNVLCFMNQIVVVDELFIFVAIKIKVNIFLNKDLVYSRGVQLTLMVSPSDYCSHSYERS